MGFMEPDTNVQQAMAAVNAGVLNPATDIRLQIELRSDARKSGGERAKVLNALRTLSGFIDPRTLGDDQGISGERHWEFHIPVGELWNLARIPNVGTTRFAGEQNIVSLYGANARVRSNYTPNTPGGDYPWLDVWAGRAQPDPYTEIPDDVPVITNTTGGQQQGGTTQPPSLPAPRPGGGLQPDNRWAGGGDAPPVAGGGASLNQWIPAILVGVVGVGVILFVNRK